MSKDTVAASSVHGPVRLDEHQFVSCQYRCRWLRFCSRHARRPARRFFRWRHGASLATSRRDGDAGRGHLPAGLSVNRPMTPWLRSSIARNDRSRLCSAGVRSGGGASIATGFLGVLMRHHRKLRSVPRTCSEASLRLGSARCGGSIRGPGRPTSGRP
jgi:hypothetical protein